MPWHWESVGGIRAFYDPIVPERATPTRLVRWAITRDLRELPLAQQEILLQKYVELFGAGASDSERLSIPGWLKFFAKKCIVSRREQVAHWTDDHEQLPAFRDEYQIVRPEGVSGGTGGIPFFRRSTNGAKAVLSSDIHPTAMLRQILETPESIAVPTPTTLAEANCRRFGKLWFQCKMNQYDQTPDAQKAEQLAKTAEELFWWQHCYNKHLKSIGLQELNDFEIMAEFSLMTTCWYTDSTPEELARLLWYKDLVVSATALKKMNIKDISRLLPLFH